MARRRRQRGRPPDAAQLAAIVLAQHALQQLARRLARQLGLEHHALGRLHPAQLAPGEAAQLLRQRIVRPHGRGRLHDRQHALPHLFARHADHRDVGDGRMRHQQILDFLRIDVHPARNDHEALAIGQEQIAIRIDVPDIAQRRPARIIMRLRRLHRIVEIFELRPVAEEDVARFPRRQLDARVVDDMDIAQHRTPDRPRLAQPFLARQGGDPAAFGARIIFVDDRSQPFDHRALDRHGAWRRRMHHGAQRR
ncbi:hypothetical protein WR25_10349 [Diploscapter pachys]|uniref:Uncharacterized protein n=1 Tax=Diploscapter pachys TaxID=2018661 RepID=A0A2A2K052_9BILA|nr:hypothetical protein WR25_10349 [Diploscapter pachys]